MSHMWRATWLHRHIRWRACGAHRISVAPYAREGAPLLGQRQRCELAGQFCPPGAVPHHFAPLCWPASSRRPHGGECADAALRRGVGASPTLCSQVVGTQRAGRGAGWQRGRVGAGGGGGRPRRQRRAARGASGGACGRPRKQSQERGATGPPRIQDRAQRIASLFAPTAGIRRAGTRVAMRGPRADNATGARPGGGPGAQEAETSGAGAAKHRDDCRGTWRARSARNTVSSGAAARRSGAPSSARRTKTKTRQSPAVGKASKQASMPLKINTPTIEWARADPPSLGSRLRASGGGAP